MVSDKDIEDVKRLLGRAPRGLQEISVRDNCGRPVVIRVASLVDGKPFPTLFWLVDKRLNYAIDQLEAGGFIMQLQQQIDADQSLQQRLVADHEDYICRRWSYISRDEQQSIEDLGFTQVLKRRGIGGIADFGRIRCLHTYYASHLISANVVGELLDLHWSQSEMLFPHIHSRI